MSLRKVAPSDAVDLEAWREAARRFQQEIGRALIGQERALRLLTIAIFARGHVLLEGDVGVGKTTLLRAAARAVGGDYERVEGTIDLMPADLVYHVHLGEDGKPRVDPGPALRHGANLVIFFFNEINRARPQVHSLLLRMMAERSVTAFNREHRFPHLLVFADRNRIEREETFELPAAARDRFLMEISIDAPTDDASRRDLAFDSRFHDADALIETVAPDILDYRRLDSAGRAIQSGVTASAAIEAYVLGLWSAIRNPATAGVSLPGIDMQRLVIGGASPRGMSALMRAARVHAWLDGRDMVVPEDIRAVFAEVMSHRIFLDPVYELRRDRILPAFRQALFDTVPAP